MLVSLWHLDKVNEYIKPSLFDSQNAFIKVRNFKMLASPRHLDKEGRGEKAGGGGLIFDMLLHEVV